MTFLMLRPVKDYLDVHGKLTYTESCGSWNILRLRSSIVRRFPQLKGKTEQFGYRMVFLDTYEELIAFLQQCGETKEAVPILLWLFRE